MANKPFVLNQPSSPKTQSKSFGTSKQA